MRAVTGEPFEIFQDVDGIGIGEHWPDKMDQMLDEARFFIPILTPSYFNSTACRDELKKFLRAEAKRGRNDLVLPIYYIECDVLEHPHLRAADPLAAEICRRQHHNWRELRFSSSFSTKAVRKALHRLATDIDRARRRSMPKETAPQTRASAQVSASRPEQMAAVPSPPAVAMPRRAAAATSSAELLARAALTWERSTDLGRSTQVNLQDTLALPDHGVTSRPETLRPGTVFPDIDAPWCPELVVIPPGEFLMGAPEGEEGREEFEGPQHLVKIGYPLAVGRYPLTFDEYDYFGRTRGRELPGDEGWRRGRRPVINVSWEDAKAYVEWPSSETEKSYRLLSEAEWEYACRAGTTTRYWWPWLSPEYANYGDTDIRKTSEVGKYAPNPWGLYDMHGNVREWVEDCWNESYDAAPDDGSAWTSGDCSSRVLRGGCWDDGAENLGAWARFADNPRYRNIVGFRVARTLSRSESVTP